MRSLWKWLRAYLAACLWAFALGALLGVVEAVTQLLRFGGWTSADGEAGLVRSIAPGGALYGWFALVVAAVFFPCFSLITRRRPHALRRAFGFSVAMPLGALAGILLGYVGHEHLFPAWWAAHENFLTIALQVAAAVVVASVLVWPLSELAERLALSPRRSLALTVVVLIVLTSLWPDWRREGLEARCGDDAAQPGDGPDVVLVTIDAWRTAEGDLPPAARALADEGVVFTNAWTSGSWTLPGMGTILTGRAARTLDLQRWRGLPVPVTTLAETARAAGWRTAAFATNPFLTTFYGFDRGFEEFEHALVLEPLTPAGRSVLAREVSRLAELHADLEDAAVVAGKAIRWLDRVPDDRPFFLWVHLLDPHLPYRSHDGGPVAESALYTAAGLAADRLKDVRDALPGLSPAERADIAGFYAGEVCHADRWAGRLFATLKARGLWDDALVVLTADHGEELFEHEGFEHGHSLLPEVTRVPLIVKLPAGAGAGRRVDADRSLLDLAPSLCAAAGWRAPDGVEGRADLWGETPRWTSAAAPDVLGNLLYGPDRVGVRAWPYLGIGPAEGPLRWYDCSARVAVALEEPPADAAVATAALSRILAGRAAAADSLRAAAVTDEGPDPAVRRQLRSLGY